VDGADSSNIVDLPSKKRINAHEQLTSKAAVTNHLHSDK
jgi:hypothetical protein